MSLALPLSAQESSEPIRVEMVSEAETIAAAEPFWVAVKLELEDGWHTYWQNPGEVGMAPQLDWKLPEGFSVSQVKWPTPKHFDHDSMVTYGYDKSVVLLAQMVPPAELAAEAVDFGVNVNWVACKDSCVPGSASHNLSLPVGSVASLGNKSFFDRARAALPQEKAVEAVQEGNELKLDVGKTRRAYFFPHPDVADSFDVVQKVENGVLSVVTLGSVNAVKGVLVVGNQSFEIDTLLSSGGGLGIWMGLIFAFLGGLILNLMPCVLPVISLKILSFVNMSGSSRRRLFEHGALFTMGVLVSFWALAGAMLVLRAYSEGIGWGFQLQEPLFVGILAMIMFLLGLSLLGVFEFGTKLTQLGGKQKAGRFGTFMSGVLATVVATPCTGPLLAPAIGYAVTLPSSLAMLLFTFVGLGMASPYLLIAAFPKLINKLPKPGAWMVTFKQIMGFLMMATVLWLLWVFASQTDSVFGLMRLMLALLVAAVGAWVYGRWGTPVVKKSRRYIAYALTAALLAMGGIVGLKGIQSADTQMIAQEGNFMAWDAEKFEELRAEGIPVFVDFTAKWCLMCQANRVPLHSKDVQKAFEEKGVVVMVADWTRRDPSITAELAKFNRNGVPLYVYYGDEEPVVLPQVLTSGNIIDAID